MSRRPSQQPSTVLITGGCGFVGTNLSRYLIDHGFDEVRVLDNLTTPFPFWIDTEKDHSRLPGIDLQTGDIRDRERVDKAVKGVNAVIHLAAHTSVVDSLQNPAMNWDINVGGTFNLLEACRENGVERFILASSNAVAGEQIPPIDEKKIPQPLSPYGASKLTGEALCSAYYHSFGIKTISLRFANLYGPYSDHKTSVITLFMQRISDQMPLTIYGDGNQTRDFVHVDDVCQAVYLSMVAEGSFGEVFQIASGKETSVNELVELLKEVTEKEIGIVYESERTGEIRRNYSDISKARRIMGYEPEIELKDGLKGLWSNDQESLAAS